MKVGAQMVNFGNTLKTLRTNRRLTQAQLGDLAGVATSAISSYESGSRYPSYDVLIRLARIFHVSTDYLLGLTKGTEIDVSGLSADEIDAIAHLVNVLKNK